MRKSILILVSSVVLLSLFNTTSTNFSLWKTPSVDNNINPLESWEDYSIMINTEPPVLGLVTNFFIELDVPIARIDLNIDLSIKKDLLPEVVIESSNIEEVEAVVKVINDHDLEDIVQKEVKEPVIAKEVKELVIAKEVKEPVMEEVLENKNSAEEVNNLAFKKTIEKNDNINKDAKELILESLDKGVLTKNDVDALLNKYSGQMVQRRHVVILIKQGR